MGDDKQPFGIDIGSLRVKPKDAAGSRVAAVDRAAAEHGFVAREAGATRGRRPSPRTGQVHAKVMPDVAAEIAAEALRRGVTQGVLIEEAWQLYREDRAPAK